MKTYESCYNHKTFNVTLDKLVQKQFYRDFKIDDSLELSDNDLEKSAWIASILAFSPSEKHKTKALSFAVLLLLENPNDVMYVNYCYIIISRTGNLPFGIHLQQVIEENTDQFKVYFDEVLNMELGIKRALSKVKLHNTKLYVSDFQKKLWDVLQTDTHVSISAPTSSGKSFIVQNLIIENCIKKPKYHVIYVVPSRSLIYEVSSELKSRLKRHEVTVKTSFESEKGSIKSKDIFVLTPERCLKLIELKDKLEFDPDLIFFDEVQNTEGDERGVLFEFILSELSSRCHNSKIVIAGPFLKKLDKTFTTISGLESELIQSIFSSVFQLQTVLRFSKQNKKKMDVLLKSPSGNTITFTMDSKLTLYSKIRGSKGEAVTNLIAQYAPQSQNIIYSNTKKSAETWAKYLSQKELYNPYFDLYVVKEIIDYLKEEVHPNYSLISCLENGVAFHHSCVPELARIEIENLYREGRISNLVCTPTLLEGVNLPAQKLFMIVGTKDKKELDNFEFGNLIGRAGRIRSHLYGSIYCIENDDEPWAKSKLDSNHEKEIIPATTKALQHHKQELFDTIECSSREIPKKSVKYTTVLLRHKFLKSPAGTHEYLKNKHLNENEIRYLLGKLHETAKRLEIPTEIVCLNPTIDPLLQNQFYNQVKNEGLVNWMISKYPLQRTKTSTQERQFPFQNKSFYYQFESLIERLDDIFSIIEDGDEDNFTEAISARQLARLAVPWLQGQTYKNIIEMNKNDSNDINSIIRNVTKNINTHVRFELVKYLKLWSDVMSSLLDENEKEDKKYYLSLPQMVEVGCCEIKALELINEGINRSIAIRIAKQIPSSYNGSVGSWIKTNKSKISLPPIMMKHLENSYF